MQIDLRINLGDEVCTVDRGFVQQALNEPLASVLQAQRYLGGEVEITDEGREPLVIADDLEQLVPRLCLQALAALEAGEAVTVPLFIGPSSVTLEPAGDQLVVVAPSGKRESYPLAAALAELEACGARFSRLLELNFPDDDGRQRKLTSMQLVLLQRDQARLRTATPPELPDWPEDSA